MGVLADPPGCWGDPRLCLSLGRGLMGHWDVLVGSELLQEHSPSPLCHQFWDLGWDGMEHSVLEPWHSCMGLSSSKR